METTTTTTDTSTALARALGLLADIRKAREALRERQLTLPDLEAAHQASAAARAEAEAARVLALADGDAQGAKGCASDAKVHASAEAKDLAALEDARRVRDALKGRIEALEAELRAVLPDVEAAVREHQQATLQDLQGELERAVAPLAAWAHRAARVASASGLRIEHQLDRIMVPALTASAALVGWGSAGGARFGTVDDGVPLPDELGEPLRVLAAVTGYRTLATCDAAVQFEVAHPTAGEATRKGIERRNAARAAELGLSLDAATSAPAA